MKASTTSGAMNSADPTFYDKCMHLSIGENRYVIHDIPVLRVLEC